MNQEVQPRYGYEDEIDLVEAFQILLKSWKLIAVFFLITVFVVGSITYFLVPKKYRSHTLLAIEAEGSFSSTFGQPNKVKEMILSYDFLRGILEKAGVESNQGEIDRLRNAITISATEAKNIRLQIIWDDPQKAYELIGLIKDTYFAQVAERINVHTTDRLRVAEEYFKRTEEAFEQLNKVIVDFQKRNNIIIPPQNLVISDQFYLDLKRQLNVSAESIAEFEKLLVEYAAAKDNYIKAYEFLEDVRRKVVIERNYSFVTIDPPVYPEQKYSPSTGKNMTIAGVLALFTGVILAFIREYIKNYQKREQTAGG